MYLPRLVLIILPAVPKSKFAVVMLTLLRGEGLVHGRRLTSPEPVKSWLAYEAKPHTACIQSDKTTGYAREKYQHGPGVYPLLGFRLPRCSASFITLTGSSDVNKASNSAARETVSKSNLSPVEP